MGGKALLSPAKKSAAASDASAGSRDNASLYALTWEEPERVDRVESTFVSRENATHSAYAKSRKEDFVYAESSQYLRILDDYCQWARDPSTSSSSVLAVISAPGQGKSALLSHWAEQRRQRLANNGKHDEFIYEHYAGCSYDSVKLSLFLFRFMYQLKIAYGLRDFELPPEHEEEKLKFSFARCLEAAAGGPASHHSDSAISKRKHVILLLDGIDCIRNEDGGDSLSWLPTSFPAGVRIIVSATQVHSRGAPNDGICCCKWIRRKPVAYDRDGDLIYDTTQFPMEHDSHTIRELHRRRATFLLVEPLDEQTCRSILQLYANKAALATEPDELEMVVSSPGSSNPLYVRLLLSGLDLFDARAKRLKWLEGAAHTSDLHKIYELLMKLWNEILLADLFDALEKCKAAAVDSSNNQRSDGDGRGMLRKTGTNKSLNLNAPTTSTKSEVDLTDIENLQVAIEQRALLVRHTLSLLTVTRYGLSEMDFSKLFGDSVSRHIGQVVLRLLRPHLLQIRRYDCADATSNNNGNGGEKVVLYDLSHNQLRLVARYGFLNDNHLRNCYYRELANYFDGMTACQRRIDELPVQLERCSMWNTLQCALVDIKMFQLWWSERNRQEYFSYWMVLRSNGAIHDPVEDLIRSLDEFIIHEGPGPDQLLGLFLTITEFLRAWQSIDSPKNGHLVLNRPPPPQLQEFMTSLGSWTTAHLPESESKRIHLEIDALSIHGDDGYYVRRWLWTQFPLIAVAFENRFLRPGNSRSGAGSSATLSPSASMDSEDNGSQHNGHASPLASPSDATSHAKKKQDQPGTVLPKGLAGSRAKPMVKQKTWPRSGVFPASNVNAGGGFDGIPEDDFGALEFLSVENSEIVSSSTSKLKTQLMQLRMYYDKLKYSIKEKSATLQALDSRLADTKALAKAADQSASQLDELLEQTRRVNDETVGGRQRSDYYKAILRHCEVNPARDPNLIESAETVVNKRKQDVVQLQQKTQVATYERKLATLEVPKLMRVIEEKAQFHDAALARLRWRHALTQRLALGDPAGVASSKLQLGAVEEYGDAADAIKLNEPAQPHLTPEELQFNRAKDKLLHKKETTVERLKKVETLKMYVGSAYKDDGVLGALRHAGINQPEQAQMFWQDQLEHGAALSAQEKESEQRVLEYREQLEALHSQLQNLKLGGATTSLSTSSTDTAGTQSSSDTGGLVAASKANSIKFIEQEISESQSLGQLKKERAARLKLLLGKLQLGLLHIAQILGVASASEMDTSALSDAVEQAVRVFLGDEAHLQGANSTNNLRRKNSARGVSQGASQSAVLPPDTRSSDDKIRLNIRVDKHHDRRMNPYVDLRSPDVDEDLDDEDEDEDDQDDVPDEVHEGRSDQEPVTKRRDIKLRCQRELEKKRTALKRAETKRKG